MLHVKADVEACKVSKIDLTLSFGLPSYGKATKLEPVGRYVVHNVDRTCPVSDRRPTAICCTNLERIICEDTENDAATNSWSAADTMNLSNKAVKRVKQVWCKPGHV